MLKLVAAAWRDGVDTIRRSPSLFTLALIGLMVIDWLTTRFVHIPSGALPTHPAPTFAPWAILFGLLASVLRSTVSAPCAVAAHRHVLIGGEADRQVLTVPARLARFFGVGVALACLVILPIMLFMLGVVVVAAHSRAIGGVLLVLGLIASVVAAILQVRLSLTLPATATDHVHPWRESWQRSQGHGWAIFIATVLCFLPLLIPGLIISALRALPAPIGPALSALGGACFTLLFIAIGAALLSHLYRRYAPATTVWL